MSNTPWNSIAESVIPLRELPRSYSEAIESPCASCATSPCCTYLPLQTFNIRNMLELSHALYLLNFDRIELGLAANGDWSVYYRYPCRFLDRTNFTCTIHNTKEQPQICVSYNPFQCWYKRVLTKSISSDFLRIDRQRMEYIVTLLVFDEARNIVQIPDWDTLQAGIAALPPQPALPTPEPDNADPIMAEWQQLALNGDYKPERKLRTYQELRDPCTNCQAYCCKTLTFPQSLPQTASNLDYFKFCLGFPGVELGIGEDSWSIVIKTTCRHLENNRCAIYGQPERPLLCRYYDEWKCSYKPNFGTPRPEGFVRVKLEQFDYLTECFQFDEYGKIIEYPTTEFIKETIEDNWRNTALTIT